MNQKSILAAEAEAKRFLARAKEWRDAQGSTLYNGINYAHPTPKQGGALRRASLDLTRALASMRRPS